MRVALMVVLVGLVFAACGSAVSSSPAPVGSGSQTRTEAPTGTATAEASAADTTPVPTRCPNPEIGLGNECLGPLAAGTYTTQLFSPTLTYTVPDGWGNLEDMPGNFLLLPPGSLLSGVNPETSDYLGVYTSVLAPGHCSGSYDPSVPRTFDGLVDWLKANPALTVTDVHDVSIGGLDGVAMDLSMKGAHGDGCSEGDFADVYVGGDPTKLVHAVGPDYPMRIAFLHNGDKTLAVELADAPNGGSDYPDWFAAATPVVESLVFGPD